MAEFFITLLKKLRIALVRFIDFFYPLAKGFLPLRTYRYAACGGLNLVFDWTLYFVMYNFILRKSNLDLYIITFSPHIASLFIVFPITFFTGFLLMKYISFSDSIGRTRTQLVKYLIVVFLSLVLNYLFLKLFVDLMHFYPTPSKILTSIITIGFSYLMQNYFTFRRN